MSQGLHVALLASALAVSSGCASRPAASPPAARPASSTTAPPEPTGPIALEPNGTPGQAAFEQRWCVSEKPAPQTPELVRACDGGQREACRSLAKASFCGAGTKVDGPRALAFVERACKAGDGLSCNAAALMSENAIRVPANPVRALSILESACAQHLPDTCVALAGLLLGRDKNRVARVAALLQSECESANPEACAPLASLYLDPHEDLASDPGKAYAFARRGCDGKFADACAQVAFLLVRGRGVAKDERGGAEMAISACEAGSALGCLNAGMAFAEGVGVSKDVARAAALLERACGMGNGLACRQLAALKRLPTPEGARSL
jgi:TPR repeat protein